MNVPGGIAITPGSSLKNCLLTVSLANEVHSQLFLLLRSRRPRLYLAPVGHTFLLSFFRI